jgi:DNA-binding transcriptional MerR regulator
VNVFLTTSRVAEILGVTEPRLSELVRRGRIRPPPIVVSGRRVWTPEQVAEAAAALGKQDSTSGTTEGKGRDQ